jgi:hypothetical protein
MRLLLLTLAICAPRAAGATCGDAANGVVEPLSYLFGTEFQDGQPVGSVTPGCIRDLIASIGPGNVGIEIDYFILGVPSPVNGVALKLVKEFSRPTAVPISPAIQCNALIGATNSTTLTLSATISGVTTSVGTMVFAAGGGANQSCTPTFNTQKSFSPGDELAIVFPVTPDATLSSVSVSIPGLQ